MFSLYVGIFLLILILVLFWRLVSWSFKWFARIPQWFSKPFKEEEEENKTEEENKNNQ
jgi:CBS domain containing-hemolysin-like protein